jgi:glycosyltransferase involved in cell wall biosynthesis
MTTLTHATGRTKPGVRLPPIVYGYLGHGWEKMLGRQALMEAMASLVPVVLLEKDSGAGRRDTYMEAVGDNRFVVRNAFRLRHTRVGKRVLPLAAMIDGSAFQRAMRSHGFNEYVFWLTVNDTRMLPYVDKSRMVYDCIDPCFLPHYQDEFDRSEMTIAKQAKIIFCTAHSLHRRMLKYNPNSFLLPNACHLDTYHACHSDSTLRPRELAGRSSPLIGYMGTVDWRFDAVTVTEVARRMPDCNFVIVGRVNKDQEANVRELRSLPNVIITGAAGYDEGHAFTKYFDVGMIPFTPGDMNDAINSVKMYMYLAAGKPIVSTWLAECIKAQPLVRATRDAAEFVEAIRNELACDSVGARRKRIAFALENTWEHRAQQAVEWLGSQGLLPPGTGNVAGE